MYDNIKGARLAAKRIMNVLGVKASQADEIVARAGGWRDTHHMRTTVGTAAAPGHMSREALTKILDEFGSAADVDRVMASIVPEKTVVTWKRIRDRWTKRLVERGHDPRALVTTVPCLSFDVQPDMMVLGEEAAWWTRKHLTENPSIDMDAASDRKIEMIRNGGSPAGRGRARAAFMLDDIVPLLPSEGGDVEKCAALMQSGTMDRHQGDADTIAARMIAETWMADEACGDGDPVYREVAETAIARLEESGRPVWPDDRFRRGLPGHRPPIGGQGWAALVDAIADDHASSLDLVAPVRLLPRTKPMDHPGRRDHAAREAARLEAAGFVTDVDGDRWRIVGTGKEPEQRWPLPTDQGSVGLGSSRSYCFSIPAGTWSCQDARRECPDLVATLGSGFDVRAPLCAFSKGALAMVVLRSGDDFLLMRNASLTGSGGAALVVPEGSRLHARVPGLLHGAPAEAALVGADGVALFDIRLPRPG